jgi:hypothetical protein
LLLRRTSPFAVQPVASSGLASGVVRTEGGVLALGEMANALMDAQGCYVDPLLALGLLASASMSGCGMRQLQSGGGVMPTMSALAAPRVAATTAGGGPSAALPLLLLHAPHDPLAARTLSATAELLSPLTTWLYHHTKPDRPRFLPRQDTDAAAAAYDATSTAAAIALTGSQLTSVNAGVAVLDVSLELAAGLPAGSKADQLTTAVLASQQQPLSSSSSQQQQTAAGVTAPITATVWAAAPNANACSVAQQRTSRGAAAAAIKLGDAFALVLRHELTPQASMMCALSAGDDAREPQGRACAAAAVAALRSHMALVSNAPLPSAMAITPAAQVWWWCQGCGVLACNKHAAASHHQAADNSSTRALMRCASSVSSCDGVQQELLSAYYVTWRGAYAAGSSSGGLSAKGALRVLLTTAQGCARCLLRPCVLPFPDCLVRGGALRAQPRTQP